MNVLGYPLTLNNSVMRLSDFFCVVESVEHLIALFTSPVTMTRLEDIDPWLSHGVMH
jgi:hypothetical protein